MQKRQPQPTTWRGDIPNEPSDWNTDGFFTEVDKRHWGPEDADELRHRFRCEYCELMVERQDYPEEMTNEEGKYQCMSCRLGLEPMETPRKNIKGGWRNE